MKKKRWTFNGIKRYYPALEFTDWLKICVKGQHKSIFRHLVVAGFIK